MKKNFVLLSVLFFLLFNSCKKEGWPCMKGKGAITKETRSVTGFTSVKIETESNVFITQGTEFKVEVEAEENIVDKIVTEKVGDQLVFHSKRCITTGTINIYITMPEITGLSIDGKGHIETTDTIDCTSLDLYVNGDGIIDVIVVTDNLSANIEGGTGDLNISAIVVNDLDITSSNAGKINLLATIGGTLNANSKGTESMTLIGSCSEENLLLTGSANLESFAMIANDCHATTTSGGNLKCYAVNNLWATISGEGSIYYKGNPTIVQSTITGSGQLIDAN